MHFIELDFLRFLAIVFALYWLPTIPAIARVLPVAPRVLQNVLLVFASALFYGWVHPWFLILLYASAVLDYWNGLMMKRHPENRRRHLILSMCGNLGMLGVFKYYNFFVDNVEAVFGAIGLPFDLWSLQILVPVGISFYTFQTMSYTIDVYRGQLEPRSNFIDYVVYVSFFPQLVAGPIERASALLPQVEKDRVWNTDRILSGFGLALWGGFKKVCIADTLAPYVDEVFMHKDPAFVMVLVAGFGFGVQMLADFGGYTDIARGTARMLGFHLMRNFDRPYSSHSTPEFWRRWHISLSSWVGDYVYTPLLRSGRPGPGRTLMAMMVTFFLIGLWHGPSWNFVLLGLYNGFWMAAYTFGIPALPRWMRESRWPGAFAWPFHTFVVLQPTGLLFRVRDLDRIVQFVFQNWFDYTDEELIAATIVFAFVALGAFVLKAHEWVEDHVFPRLKPSPWFLPAQTTFWAMEALAIFVFYRDASEDFIYFEF